MRRLLWCALLIPALASAEIYRWTDAQGRVHFGERPGASNAQTVEVKPQVVERDDATRQREQRTEQFYEARRAEQVRDNQQAAAAQAKRAEECRQLRHNQAQIQQSGRFYSSDANGNRVYYSDKEMDAARSRLSTQIAQRCS